MKKSLRYITRSAVIAAIYFALSTAIKAIGFGPVQFRLSEALVLLPVFMPESIPGLVIGCFFTNFFFSPYGFYDMLFGTLATLLGALGTYFLRRHVTLAALPPMIFNAVLVPIIWVLDGSGAIYYISMFEILASELIIVGVIGIPFTLTLKKAFTAAGLVRITGRKYKDTPAYFRQTVTDFENDEIKAFAEPNNELYKDAPRKISDAGKDISRNEADGANEH